jgi:hypothetical protein
LELGAGSFFWHDNNLGYEAAIAIAEVRDLENKRS